VIPDVLPVLNARPMLQAVSIGFRQPLAASCGNGQIGRQTSVLSRPNRNLSAVVECRCLFLGGESALMTRTRPVKIVGNPPCDFFVTGLNDLFSH
jgi:hypothetical protein